MEPIKLKAKAESGDKALVPQIAVFIARGIEILLSRVGHIATSITASHMQFAKLSLKKSNIKSILHHINYLKIL